MEARSYPATRRSALFTGLLFLVAASSLTLISSPARGAFPGVNGKIVFWSGRSTYNLFLMDPDGTDRRPL